MARASTEEELAKVALLNQQQLTCLRLVGTGTSKIIAAELGLSPHTVDTYIGQAMRILGAADRHQAAALVRIHDRRSEKFISDQHPLAGRPDSDILTPPATAPGNRDAEPVNVVREDRRPFGIPASTMQARPAPRQLGVWNEQNQLSPGYRIIGIVGGAVVLTILTLMVLASADALQRTLSRMFGGG